MSKDQPGDIINTWEDSSDHGLGVVVCTSRHKRRLTLDEARARLAAEAATMLVGRDVDPAPLRDHLASKEPFTWWSVTKSEVDLDDHMCGMECDPGAWCSEGRGSASVTVLSVTNGEVYDLLDNPDRAAV